MQIASAIPILRIFDEALAREFYLDYAGFTLDWEHRFEPGMPLYCQVRRGDLCLHLTEHAGDCSPAARVFIPMKDIDALHTELASKPYQLLRPGVSAQEWGREITLIDPFGNRLTFCELNDG